MLFSADSCSQNEGFIIGFVVLSKRGNEEECTCHTRTEVKQIYCMRLDCFGGSFQVSCATHTDTFLSGVVFTMAKRDAE